VESLRRLADQLEQASAVFAGARPDEHDPPGDQDGQPGAPGEVMAALRRQLGAALHSRTREASAAATRLGGLAAELRVAAAGYATTDESARSRAAGLEEA
jgi:hypothetical protein